MITGGDVTNTTIDGCRKCIPSDFIGKTPNDICDCGHAVVAHSYEDGCVMCNFITEARQVISMEWTKGHEI